MNGAFESRGMGASPMQLAAPAAELNLGWPPQMNSEAPMPGKKDHAMPRKKSRGKSRERVVKEHPLELFARRQEEAEKNDPRLIELRDAAAAGDVAKIKRLLKLGLDPSALPPDGDITALLAAVYAGKSDAVRVLVEAGADVNDGWPYKPLGVAAGRGALDLVRVLIAGGAM
jgi:ankyrin repeat protein